MAQRDPELQRLLDEAEITRVLQRYCRGIDRLDEELIRSVYHDDATDDHGAFKGRASDFAPWVIKALVENYDATQHVLGQKAIDVQGDVAYGDTHVLAYHRKERDGGTDLITFGGRYVDRFERRNDEWKIADRVVVHEWSKSERTTTPFDLDAFEPGRRSRDDLSYRRG